jgi:AAA domain, putative AbiEii toxin, Type IV TA system
MNNTMKSVRQHDGARWIRAAVQVNPYGYKGKGAPSTKFPDENAYNTALLDKCVELNIELIAITDHWSIDGSVKLIGDAEARGIVALPGFEANTAEGVHLLVLFEVGIPASEVNAAIGACGVAPNCANGTTGRSFKDVMEDMTQRGALVIPAHANVANSGMLTGRTGTPLVQMVQHPDLHAIGITPTVAATADQAAIFLNRLPYKREHPVVEIQADDISHPDTLATPGGTTWFKMSSPCLKSLKHAVRIPSTRVSKSDPSIVNRPIIREVSWVGGFLDGVTVDISEDLTTFIGGRGTGKSTALESLRYALALTPLGPAAQMDHKSIVNDVLKAGTTVRVTVDAVSPTVERYVVERTVPNISIVIDAKGRATNLSPADVTGSVEVFGQHELAELAQDKGAVARMLERFSGPKAGSTLRADVTSKLAENRRKLERAEDDRSALEAELADLPRLQDQVDLFAKTDLAKKLAAKQRLHQDEAVFTELFDRVQGAASLLADLELDSALGNLAAPIDTIKGSTEEALLEQAELIGQNLGGVINSAIAGMQAAIQAAEVELNGAKTKWSASTGGQQAAHDAVIRQLVEQGLDPAKYLETTSALDALKAKALRRTASDVLLTALLKDRSELLRELALADGQISKALTKSIRQANDITSPAVNVRPIPAEDRQDIKQLVIDHTKGPRTLIMAAIEADDFSTAAFAAAARKGSGELESKYGIRGAQEVGILRAGERLFRPLEELSVGQAVDVFLDTSIGPGPQSFRRLDQLSKGQRATALLLLLLGASSSALIIDQPEDDLDNRFVYNEIVQKLRELKGTRQVIVTTHNANVPVLGDAELIIVLDGDGQKAWPVPGGVGSLDNPKIRELAEDLLEGGKDAFEARKHLYDF